MILSSCLQTPIGNMSSIHVASALQLKNNHGLNNHVFFDYPINKTLYFKDNESISLEGVKGLGIAADD